MLQIFVKLTSLKKIISLWSNSTFKISILLFGPTKKRKILFKYIYIYIYIYI